MAEAPVPTNAEARSEATSAGDPPPGEDALRLLFERPAPSGPARNGLSGELARRYDGDLAIALHADRPTLVVNFVETLDGAVALRRAGRGDEQAPARGGGDAVSGSNPADGFVRALLRAMADVVLVGAGVARGSRGTGWTPGAIDPAHRSEFAALRRRLGLQPEPTALIVTRTGNLDPAHPGFRDPAGPLTIAGPGPALDRLRAAGFPAWIDFVALDPERPLGTEIAAIAGRIGARVVVSEAGPHVFAELVGNGDVDELFLTVSPQLVGRDAATSHLALVEGTALWPDRPAWATLASVRQAGDHLFLRYGFGGPRAANAE